MRPARPRFVVLTLAVTLSASAPALSMPDDDGEKSEPAGFDVRGCAMQEAWAALTCCGSIGLIGFGVATLGVSPVFANVPLPIGVCGIGLGAVGVLSAVAMACAAPFGAAGIRPPDGESREDDDDDGGDTGPPIEASLARGVAY